MRMLRSAHAAEHWNGLAVSTSSRDRWYCEICGRQPLCGSCAHGLWWQTRVPMQDIRWRQLTAAAAASTTGPRTAGAGEIRSAVRCCQCRGELDQEHNTPELPQPVVPGRPVGWTMCPHCQVSYSTLDNGARIQHYSCKGQHGNGPNGASHGGYQDVSVAEGGRITPIQEISSLALVISFD